MNIWFILWLVLSGTLLYFLSWTLYILFRQKTTWKNFAKKHRLRYRSKQLLFSPEISGTLENYTIGIFTGEHVAGDMRNTRKLTAVEVHLSSTMPIEGAVASDGMVELVREMSYKEEMCPKHPKWDESFIASSDNKHVLEDYLSTERLDALTSLMKIKNSWVILIFKEKTMLLRFDTPDPLDADTKLEKITRKMIEAAKVLELKPGEGERLKSKDVQKAASGMSLDIDEEKLDANLKLEDEG